MPDTCSAHASMQQRSDEQQAPEWDESMRNGNESERLGDERALGVFCVAGRSLRVPQCCSAAGDFWYFRHQPGGRTCACREALRGGA